MANLFRRSFLFAAGSLVAAVATPAIVRVTSRLAPSAADSNRELLMAILAEGSQWEVRTSGRPGWEGPWYIDVPASMENLSPGDRMMAVDKIMRRLAQSHKDAQLPHRIGRTAPLAISAPGDLS